MIVNKISDENRISFKAIGYKKLLPKEFLADINRFGSYVEADTFVKVFSSKDSKKLNRLLEKRKFKALFLNKDESRMLANLIDNFQRFDYAKKLIVEAKEIIPAHINNNSPLIA